MPADDQAQRDRVRGAFESALAEGVRGGEPPSVASLKRLFPGFEVELLLGRGGMGAVYRARQLSLDRIVAIKLLPFELGVQEEFAERFRREAKALARLAHPNIVAAHDYGQANDGHFYLVMEYVEGEDLSARLRRGKVPAREAVRIVAQVCDALAFAHAQGVVHRDIKPSNILISTSGAVKVTDFGIARWADDTAGTSSTQTAELLGTPGYVAPEQMRPGATVDARADLFSLGVMLYELVTGELPQAVLRPLSRIDSAAGFLDPVIRRALQPAPSDRYPTVTELRRDLLAPARVNRRLALTLGVLLGFVGLAVLAYSLALKRAGSPGAPGPARGATTTERGGTAAVVSGIEDPADKAFVNSLGQRFVEAGTPGVRFCATETRVREFAAFADENSVETKDRMWMNQVGGLEGWHAEPGTWRSPGFSQSDEHPAVGVSYLNAIAFCQWLTEKERRTGLIQAGDLYRLPTNAEWNVAAGLAADANAPSGRYLWGTRFPPPPGAGNFPGAEIAAALGSRHEGMPIISGYRDPFPFTAPVGKFGPNAFGLFDLGGNVWEWTEPTEHRKAWLRGGSWWDAAPERMDAAARIVHFRDLHCYSFGFRVVLERREDVK